MKKVLVIVDVQKDFYHPDGALYVKGGEVLPERIAKVIPQFDGVLFTVDWHPVNHCSFKENGGIWPVHCVAFSEGASLPEILKPYIKGDHGLAGNVIRKGCFYETEEYGAKFHLNSVVSEVVFCGIAGDYCVKETIKNFIKEYPTLKTKVYLDGVVSIDDGTTLRTFMEENNIGEWKPE